MPASTTPAGDRASLGPIFRSTRTAAGISVRAVASRAGLSHTSVSRWERGEREISEATYQHLTTALADYLAGRWAA